MGMEDVEGTAPCARVVAAGAERWSASNKNAMLHPPSVFQLSRIAIEASAVN
jgi:hypothetical protein